jgi:hypothetical protein
MGRPKKKWVLCTKTFHDHVSNDHLEFNKVDPKLIGKHNSYPLFEKGKKYNIIGPMNTLSENIISYIDSDLKMEYNGKKISNLFYMTEFNKKKMDEWNNKKGKYIDIYKDDKESLDFILSTKPINYPFFENFFEYIEK